MLILSFLLSSMGIAGVKGLAGRAMFVIFLFTSGWGERKEFYN